MKLPIAWLKKYIDVKVSAEKLAEMLTMSGTAVERIEREGGHEVLDIEVTTNRPDCLSILGLAREVSALTGKKLKIPAAYGLPDVVPGGGVRRSKRMLLTPPRGTTSGQQSKKVDITVEDKKGCPLYTARLIEGVSVKAAPVEVRTFLESAGIRPISNVVDATNFVLLESGQPLHAFDYDKIKGSRIIVRRAWSGEKFIGIDGIEYTLDEKTLVIADAERPIAIAGVMGGKLTEVGETTRNVLLESAYFDPGLIRQASRRYKISTESSYRFERKVNPVNVGPASQRAADLAIQWASGRDASGLLEKRSAAKPRVVSFSLRLSRVEKLLGLKISRERAAAILKSLAFKTVPAGQDTLRVTVDPSRSDITQEADLIEEILRIEGFDKIPVRIPPTRYRPENPRDSSARTVAELKQFMAGLGFDEIVTYSLLPERTLAFSGFDQSACHRIVNAQSAEQAFFRPSLLPGALGAFLFNLYRKADALKFFEIGKRYTAGREELVMGLGLSGWMAKDWRRKTPADFYDLKGLLENIFDFFGTGVFTWEKGRDERWAESGGTVSEDGKAVAWAGKVSGRILRAWDVPQDVFFAEIRLEPLLTARRGRGKIKPVPKYPSVRRDVAFIADRRISVGDLEALMKKSAAGSLEDLSLFDEYSGKNIPEDKRSLAFSLSFQKETGTFTDEEIQRLERCLKEDLRSVYGVEFR